MAVRLFAAPRTSALGAVLVIALAVAGCTKTSFGGKKGSAAQPIAKTPIPETTKKPGVTSPPEVDVGTVKNPVVECGGQHRALRMAIVIDTSSSMGPATCGTHAQAQMQAAAQNGTLELDGSDPARTGTSIRGANECHTDRQNAAWRIVTRTVERDLVAEKANATFMGSEVGLAHFPKGLTGSDSDTYAKISGEPPLKKAMTNLTSVTLDDTFKNTLWTSLDRTHVQTGVTPYLAALSAGYDLLKTGRDPNDTRKDVLFIITDGLPTDQRPSAVRAARAELKDVDVVYLYMFDPKVAEATRQAAAKSALQNQFAKGWARQAGNTDGYAAGDFEKYWADLIALPDQIATTRIDVTQPSELSAKLDAILESAQVCKK